MSAREHASSTVYADPEAALPAQEITITGIFAAVTQYYDLSTEELLKGGPHFLEMRDARAVTFAIMSERTDLSIKEMAEIMSTASQSAKQIITRVEKLAAEDPKLRTHIEELSRAAGGEPLAKTPATWLDLAAQHYGVPVEDMIGRREPTAYEARQLGAYLLSENTVLKRSAIARKVGYYGAERTGVAIDHVHGESRNDADFAMDLSKLEQGELPAGQEERQVFIADKAKRKRAADSLVEKICAFYGVEPSEVSGKSIANRSIRPRRVAAYLLIEELNLPVHEVMSKLKRGQRPTVLRAHHEIQQEIAENPMFAEEIEYIKKFQQASHSINERIIDSVAKATHVGPDDIMSGKEPESFRARQMAMTLMAERGHLSPPEIARFFGQATEGSVYRARTMVEFQQPKSLLLAAQLKWVRSRLLTQKTENPFAFEDVQPVSPETGSQAIAEGKLPDINETLVHPEIKDEVYRIVEETASFYGVSAVEVAGRSEDFLVMRARKAAVLRCREARLPMRETALCFDGRHHSSLLSLSRKVRTDANNNPILAEELRAMGEGEERRDVLGETVRSVTHYYNIRLSELYSSRAHRSVRARAVFLAVMSEHASNTYDEMAAAAGCSTGVALQIHARISKRLKTDIRLKAEVDYLMDPGRVRRPPDAHDILLKIRDSFSISSEELMRPQTEEGRKAKRSAAYILADELGITNREIAKILGMNRERVPDYIRHIQKEVAEQPQRILEIDKLRPPHSTSFSKTARILHFAAKRQGVGLAELFSEGSTPEVNNARLEAAELLQKSGFSVGNIVSLLGMPRLTIENIVLAKAS